MKAIQLLKLEQQTLQLIMKNGFFITKSITQNRAYFQIQKNEKCISDIPVSQCISKPFFVLLYVCDLSYFDV